MKSTDIEVSVVSLDLYINVRFLFAYRVYYLISPVSFVGQFELIIILE